MVHVTVNWSPLLRVTGVKVFSATIVPPDAAVKRPAFLTSLWVALAVNVFATVNVASPLVCAYVPCALSRPPEVISPVKVVSPAAGAVVSELRARKLA
jgi:hypothetical protein